MRDAELAAVAQNQAAAQAAAAAWDAADDYVIATEGGSHDEDEETESPGTADPAGQGANRVEVPQAGWGADGTAGSAQGGALPEPQPDPQVDAVSPEGGEPAETEGSETAETEEAAAEPEFGAEPQAEPVEDSAYGNDAFETDSADAEPNSGTEPGAEQPEENDNGSVHGSEPFEDEGNAIERVKGTELQQVPQAEDDSADGTWPAQTEEAGAEILNNTEVQPLPLAQDDMSNDIEQVEPGDTAAEPVTDPPAELQSEDANNDDGKPFAAEEFSTEPDEQQSELLAEQLAELLAEGDGSANGSEAFNSEEVPTEPLNEMELTAEPQSENGSRNGSELFKSEEHNAAELAYDANLQAEPEVEDGITNVSEQYETEEPAGDSEEQQAVQQMGPQSEPQVQDFITDAGEELDTEEAAAEPEYETEPQRAPPSEDGIYDGIEPLESGAPMADEDGASYGGVADQGSMPEEDGALESFSEAPADPFVLQIPTKRASGDDGFVAVAEVSAAVPDTPRTVRPSSALRR